MSTYLVALVVSDFKCIKSTARPHLSKNINVASCARPNAINQLDFAHNVAVKVLEFFEKHFNVTYPLPKSGKLIFLLCYIVENFLLNFLNSFFRSCCIARL